MKKTLSTAAVTALCISALVSCGSEKMYDYNYDDYLTLGTYKGVEVSRAEIQEEIEKQYSTILSQNAYDEEISTPAETGNKVTYSYTGTVDGTEIEALKITDGVYTVGTTANNFSELDDILSSAVAGTETTVTVQVPETYTADESIAGKEAVLALSITKVTETITPETLTDEMVDKYTSGDYTVIADYEAYLYDAFTQNHVWEAVMDGTTFTGYPEKEAEHYYDSYVNSYTQMSAQYGMTISSLASAYGMTTDAFYQNLASQAVRQVNQDMVMYSIAEKENLVPGDAEIAKTKEELLKSYDYKDEKALIDSVGEEAIEMSAKYDMVLKFLAENVTYVD